MRRSRTLLTLLALVALMATAGEKSTAYTAAPKPVKQVVKTQHRAKMLTTREASSRKKAPSADLFQGLTMYVNLTNSNDWAGYGIASVPYGIYSYTIGTDADFQPLATDLRYDFMASAMGRDQLVGARPMELFGSLNGVEYNGLSRDDFHELWSQVYEQVDYSFIPSVMAYDMTSDIMYSIQYNSDLTGLNLAVWNAETRMFETVCPWPNRFQPMAMGFTPNGEMYCVGSDGEFYQMDKETADVRSVGTLDAVPTMYVQGMGYEPRTGCFVWMAVTQQGSGIYAINPYDASTTLIQELTKNEQAPSVFFKGNQAPDAAPAAISDLAFTFDGSSTTGNITFTIPSTTYSGAALSGNVMMSVWLDGEPIANMVSVAPGSRQSFSREVSNDNHYVYVLLENAGGYSPANYVYTFAGYDTPLPVTNVTFTVEDGVSHLTWDAPATGVNGGYLDGLTYNVVRMPGNVLVADHQSACEFSETLPSKMERYYYIVTPFNADGKQGDEALSNAILTGTAFQAPYFDDFSDASTRDLWTIVNANNDQSDYGTVYTWQFNDYNSCWGIYTGQYNMGADVDGADDYLISPGIEIEEGISYALIVNMRNTWANYKERASLLIGTDPTDISTFTVLAQDDAYDVGGNLTPWEADFQVEQTGTYYFAVRAYTLKEDNASGIFVYSMAVNQLGKNEAPAEVTDLTITPDEEGEMIADVTFTVPSTTLDGSPLTSSALTANIYRDGAEPAVAQVPVQAGSSATWTDNTVQGVGVHTYTVAISNEAGEGKRVSAEAFIGVYTAPYTNTFDTEADARFFYTVNDSSIYSTNEYRWLWGSYNQNLALGGYGYFVQHPVEKIWLYMPAIKLEKDMVYTYAFNWTYSSYNQVCPGYAGIGMAPDSTAQTIYPDQLPFTNYGEKVLIENEVIASETGKYYPSILMVADVASSYISPSIDDISITLVGSAFAPYSVENLVVENDKTGLLKVNFAFNAPSVDYAQRPLEGPLKVYIYRSGSAIPLMTFDNVEPGQALVWVDEQPLNGTNSYIIVAENEYGRGKVSEATVFAGVDVPLAVENFWIRGNEDNQMAVLTWDAPSEVGVNGGVVDGSLTYTIVEYFPQGTTPEEQMVVIGTTTETSYTVERKPTDEMEMHYYAVIPSTSAGIGQAVIDDIVLGKLKQAPFTESFADGYIYSSGWVVDADVADYGTIWYVLADNEEMTSQDGDNGYAMCYNGNYYNSYHWSDLVTPKVEVDPTKQYTLSFWVYMGYSSSAAVMPTLVVSQSLNDDPYEELMTIDVTEGDGEWQLFEIPVTGTELANFMKFSFRGYMSMMSERIWLDNIRITAENKPSSVNELASREQIAAVKGGISIEGFEGQQVRVFTVDGRQVENFVADGYRTLSMSPGIYIVTVGKQAYKISVR
ncbi:MAG: choice-of-anchor J domain-containing protein [Muribaculaceae bacterium]|nr:choice-of-anchor J domain-containing protein [Muribaculaceae bacterium]